MYLHSLGSVIACQFVASYCISCCVHLRFACSVRYLSSSNSSSSSSTHSDTGEVKINVDLYSALS